MNGPTTTEAELRALTDGALVIPLPGTGRLTAVGADRLDFVHGQLANDVKGLREGETNRSLLLNHKGHALALVQVLRFADRLELVVEGGALALVEESLRRHIVFDQVALTPGKVESLTIQGPAAADVLSRAVEELYPGSRVPSAGRFAPIETPDGTSAWLVPSLRSQHGGFDLHVAGNTGSLRAALVAAGGVPGTPEAGALARICAGAADAEHEGGDGVLPQEAGLEGYLSYRKGCYLGQEIMARIEARGNLRRRLGLVQLEDMPEGDGRDIRFDGKQVGRLGGVARHPLHGVLALAILRADLPEEAVLEVAGTRARTRPLPLPLAPDRM